MVISRTGVRSIATRLLVGTVAAILLAVGAEWFIQVATDKGWYSGAGRAWDRLVASLTAFLTSFPVLAFGLVLAGFVAGLWVDVLLVRRARERWWEGLHTLTVRSFSCLVAGVPEAKFETSPRAKAIAAEILSYVNSGHIGLALEMPLLPDAASPDRGYGVRYPTKREGPDAILFKRDLERLAPSRGWQLPWPIMPTTRPLAPQPNAVEQAVLSNKLLDALYGDRKG